MTELPRLDNAHIARIFRQMADLLDIAGEDRYRARAFRQTARTIEELASPVATSLARGDLTSASGLGPGSLDRIKEIIRVGDCAEHRRLVARFPPGLAALLDVKGLGSGRVRTLYERLGVSDLDGLSRAVDEGRVAPLPGFDVDVETQIRLTLLQGKAPRLLLDTAFAIGQRFVDELRRAPGVVRIQQTGSARRGKATVRDLDILVASVEKRATLAEFAERSSVGRVFVRGGGRASVLVDGGTQVDVRVVRVDNFGDGLHYFTGSKAHNVALRTRANRRGLHVSDKGIFRHPEKHIKIRDCQSEDDVFGVVGLPFIPPELRENQGEIEAAADGRLPRVVHDDDVQHLWFSVDDQPTNNDEHFIRLCVPNGVDRDDEVPCIRLTSADVQLPAKGRVAVWLDWHASPDPRALAATLLDLLDDGRIAIVAGLTGRRLPDDKRSAACDDTFLERVLSSTLVNNAAIGLDCAPNRLDPDVVILRACRLRGVPIALLAASGAKGSERLRFGLMQARRAGCRREDVLNTLPIAEARERLQLPVSASAPNTTLVVPSPQLALELTRATLEPAMRTRLQAFLTSGEDAELLAALLQLSENPLQAAFDLLMRGQAQLVDD